MQKRGPRELDRAKPSDDASGSSSDEEESRTQFLVPALLPPASRVQASADSSTSPARLVCYIIFGRAESLEPLRAPSKGYVSVGEVAGKLFLPKGMFTAVLGKVVEECQRVHNMSISDMVGSFMCFLSTWPIPKGEAYLASGTVQTCAAQGFCK